MFNAEYLCIYLFISEVRILLIVNVKFVIHCLIKNRTIYNVLGAKGLIFSNQTIEVH